MSPRKIEHPSMRRTINIGVRVNASLVCTVEPAETDLDTGAPDPLGPWQVVSVRRCTADVSASEANEEIANDDATVLDFERLCRAAKDDE